MIRREARLAINAAVLSGGILFIVATGAVADDSIGVEELRAFDNALTRIGEEWAAGDSTSREGFSAFGVRATTRAEEAADGLSTEQEIALRALAESDRRQSSRQLSAPSLTGSATSLSSRALAPDVLGLALNLRNLSASTEKDTAPTSASANFSAYALAAALYGVDPSNNAFSNQYGKWRRLSFQLAYDDEPGEDRKRSVAAGVKIVLGSWNQTQEERFSYLAPALGFGRAVVQANQRAFDGRGGEAAMRNASLRELLRGAGGASRFFDEMTARRARSLKGSLEFTTRQGTGMPDEYAGKLIIEKAIIGNLEAVGNIGFEYKEISGAKDQYGGTGVLDFVLPLSRIKENGILPSELSLGVEANWFENAKDTYKGQLRLEIPVPKLPGVRIPLSVTFANRKDLVSESEVRGLVGFTIDPTAFLKGLDNLGN